ncbi:hypothetical protein Avbf_09324 [Armadillidium vulgare]|nr:hypothetical protein Avbf_09324 [Armadillidium vulgare]
MNELSINPLNVQISVVYFRDVTKALLRGFGPCITTLDDRPVCGTNNKTYENPSVLAFYQRYDPKY